jgi:hypothetical protein
MPALSARAGGEVKAPLPAAQRIDLGVLGKPPEPLFRKRQPAIDGDFEDAAGAFDELDLGAELFDQPCPRTEGSRFIVSRHAIFDPDLHRSSSG